MYELRTLVADLFIEHREGIFEMELGRVAYELLEMNPDTKIPTQMEKFSNMQRIEVLRCMKEGLTIEPLIRHKFNSKQMSELRQSLRHGFDIDIICDPAITDKSMALVRRAFCKGVNISQVNVKLFEADQLKQIILCAEQGLDYTRLLDETMDADTMSDLRNTMARESALENKTSEKYRLIHESIFGDKIR